MNTDDAQIISSAPPGETAYPHRELTQLIIGAAMEVHRELGPGFLERVYEGALMHELESRGMKATAQAEIEVHYKGTRLGIFYADILVDTKVICEIKASENISASHESQLIHYLKATGIPSWLAPKFRRQTTPNQENDFLMSNYL